MLFFELNLHYFITKKGFKISFKTLKRDTNKLKERKTFYIYEKYLVTLKSVPLHFRKVEFS